MLVPNSTPRGPRCIRIPENGHTAVGTEDITVRNDDLYLIVAIDIRGQNPGLPDDALGEGMLDVLAAVEWTGPCFADLNDDDVLDLADVRSHVASLLGQPSAAVVARVAAFSAAASKRDE